MILQTVAFVLMGLIVLGAIIYAVGTYNTLVRLDKNIGKNFSNIDVILLQRYDELPKLVNACKAYMKHERDVFEKVTSLRESYKNAATREAKVETENELSGFLGQIWARTENYPELKANQEFLHIHERISSLENTIADRRELFNESVTAYNIYLNQFPTLLFARIFGGKSRTLLKLPAQARKDTKDLF